MLFLMLAMEAAADVLTPGKWDGSLETDLGYNRDNTVYGGSTTYFDENSTLYQLNLQNSGFSVIDPALLLGTVGISLGVGQDNSSVDGVPMAVNSGVLGYSLDAEFLNDLPYGGALFATSSRANVSQPFGYQLNNNSDRGLTMRLNEGSPLKDMGLPYLGSNLRLEEQNLDQFSVSALNQNYRFVENSRIFSLDGHKGSETSDLTWSYADDDISQPLTPIGNNRTQNANLAYSDDFGQTLGNRIDSRFNYYDRTGEYAALDMSTLSVNEALQVAHQSNLSTSYNYQLMRQVSQNQPFTSQTGTFNVMYQPYQSLSTSLEIQRQIVPSETIDIEFAGLGYQYLHQLPMQGTLHFTTTGGYGQTQISSSDIPGQVNYEAHPFTFDPLAVDQEITLSQAFVNESAPIAVYAVNSKQNAILGGGALVVCPGITMPSDGTCDYIIEPPLGGKTNLRINSRSTTLTGLGNNVDTLEVSYSYNVPTSLTYSTTTSVTSLTADYHWIVFTLAHSVSVLNQLSGVYSPFLQSTRQDTAGIDMKGTWRGIQFTCGTNFQSTDQTLLVYQQERYYSTAIYPYSYYLSFGLNADTTISQYQFPDRTTQISGLHVTSTWMPVGFMTVSSSVGRRSMADSLEPTQTVDEASVRTQMKYGKVSMNLTLTADRQQLGISELNELSLMLTLMRSL